MESGGRMGLGGSTPLEKMRGAAGYHDEQREQAIDIFTFQQRVLREEVFDVFEVRRAFWAHR